MRAFARLRRCQDEDEDTAMRKSRPIMSCNADAWSLGGAFRRECDRDRARSELAAFDIVPVPLTQLMQIFDSRRAG
jgi:hypothetical protein